MYVYSLLLFNVNITLLAYLHSEISLQVYNAMSHVSRAHMMQNTTFTCLHYGLIVLKLNGYLDK